MKRAQFIADTRREFLAEVRYHNQTQAGLGGRFAAIEEATARALIYPDAGSLSTATNTRRVMLKNFLFSLHYRHEQEGIVIFAIANHLRSPNYWQERTTKA